MEIKEQLQNNHVNSVQRQLKPQTRKRKNNRVQLQQEVKRQVKVEQNRQEPWEKSSPQRLSTSSNKVGEKIKQQDHIKHQSQIVNGNQVQQVLAMRGSENKIKKYRKTRTLITKEKLLEMNKIFSAFIANKSYQGQYWNLKTIANHLELGYSTILHKFREFRANKIVKAGALISSLQKKRKYKKSIRIEKIIEQVLKDQEFYTAVQMTNFIEKNYNIKVSRSIVSRHLGQMGYSYKNVGHTSNLNNAKLASVRQIYAQIMKPLLVRKQTLIYIDEMSCCFRQQGKEEDTTISILIACTIYGVLYFHLQDGFINRERFYTILTEFLVNLRQSPLCKNIQGEKEQLYIVVDMNSIHRDDNNNMPGIASMLIEKNAEIYYIPPNTPEFNPIEPIFEQIREQFISKTLKIETIDHRRAWEWLEVILQEIKAEPTEEYFVEMCQKMQEYMQNKPDL